MYGLKEVLDEIYGAKCSEELLTYAVLSLGRKVV